MRRFLTGGRGGEEEAGDIEADMAALGIVGEAAERFRAGRVRRAAASDIEIFEDNLDAFRLFAASASQARTGPMGGFLGLDYQGVEAAARMSGIAMTPELFDQVRICEGEAVKILNRRSRDG